MILDALITFEGIGGIVVARILLAMEFWDSFFFSFFRCAGRLTCGRKGG